MNQRFPDKVEGLKEPEDPGGDEHRETGNQKGGKSASD